MTEDLKSFVDGLLNKPCPICAGRALLRDPELLGRLAEHASGFLAVLKEALREPVSHDHDDEPAPAPRPVQHITVTRRKQAEC